MNILDIRDRLNELPFQQGKRQVLIGRLSERCDPAGLVDETGGNAPANEIGQAADAIEQHLQQLGRELSQHQLQLARGDDDPDLLYAVQRLRRQTEVDLSWMGAAMTWSARIMAVALEMVLPVVSGMWLDAQFGTQFVALVGICIGLPLGLWHITRFARQR